MLKRLITLIRDARAATAIEYGLIVALIVIAVVAGISVLGGATGSMWGLMTTKVGNAMPVS